MTTIAWDGKTLAADRMAVHGGTKARVRKIFDCGEYHYAACGLLEEAIVIAEWLTAGASKADRLSLAESHEYGIVVRKSDAHGFVLIGKPIVLIDEVSPYLATGSGHEYARAALALGKTAAQAVAFASRFDLHTGLGVDTIRVRGRPLTPRPASSACRCKTWPCSCACHKPPRPRVTLADYLEAVVHRVWRLVRTVERKLRDITGDV